MIDIATAINTTKAAPNRVPTLYRIKKFFTFIPLMGENKLLADSVGERVIGPTQNNLNAPHLCGQFAEMGSLSRQMSAFDHK